jgi:hypothetical protein
MKTILLIRDPKDKEEERIVAKFEEASRIVKNPKTTTDSEHKYSIAYQNLVKLGLVQQLKKKFR